MVFPLYFQPWRSAQSSLRLRVLFEGSPQEVSISLRLMLWVHGKRSQYIALEFVGVDARYTAKRNVISNYVVGFCNKGKCFWGSLLYHSQSCGSGGVALPSLRLRNMSLLNKQPVSGPTRTPVNVPLSKAIPTHQCRPPCSISGYASEIPGTWFTTPRLFRRYLDI